MGDHLDVLVIGAGISGIGAAYHLQTMCPTRTYAIVEARSNIGGTWDLFRYPGVRSDSDMHTLGYGFKPWTSPKSIADGPSILAYLEETVAEYGIGPHIQFDQRVTEAQWDSPTSRWTVTMEHAETGETSTLTCSFLFVCSGYYSYRQGHTPEFPGRDRFGGEIVHPQFWPDALDYAGERVIVIGSGATAMTLVPAMAADAERVTMVQRSPTYVIALPDEDPIANALRKVLPDRIAYAITRRKNIALQQFVYKRSRTNPEKMKARLISLVRKQLGDDYDVETHFTPTYGPWDQRLCLLTNGDLFEAIRSGRAEIVTDTIATFTETGIALDSGRHLDADIIVTATGLELVTLGEIDVSVDGEAVDFSSTFTYKGLAYSDVPNLASTFGYVNASWTLRADLTSQYVCRLLNHMEATGTTQCTPRLRRADTTMTSRAFVEDFSAGYIRRVAEQLPKQGDRAPWIHPQHYRTDRQMLLKSPVDDGVMRFTTPAGADADEKGDGSDGSDVSDRTNALVT